MCCQRMYRAAAFNLSSGDPHGKKATTEVAGTSIWNGSCTSRDTDIRNQSYLSFYLCVKIFTYGGQPVPAIICIVSMSLGIVYQLGSHKLHQSVLYNLPAGNDSVITMSIKVLGTMRWELFGARQASHQCMPSTEFCSNGTHLQHFINQPSINLWG